MCILEKGCSPVHLFTCSPSKTSFIRSDVIRHPPYNCLITAYLRPIYGSFTLPHRYHYVTSETHYKPCTFFAHHCANLRPSVSCVREFRERVCPPFISPAFYAGYSFRLLRGASAPRSPFLGSYAGFNPAYCVSVYWFISLLLASSTVRISFALRTSTSRLFRMFCSPRYSAVFFLLFPGIGCRCSSPSMER